MSDDNNKSGGAWWMCNCGQRHWIDDLPPGASPQLREARQQALARLGDHFPSRDRRPDLYVDDERLDVRAMSDAPASARPGQERDARAHSRLRAIIAAAYRSGIADADSIAEARGLPSLALTGAAKAMVEERIVRLAEMLARQAERGEWPKDET